eukprot:1895879-Ditylum_brightwellii.AAC.1
MYQAVGTQQQPAQWYQQQINAAVPTPNTQNESDGMSSSVQEYTTQIMVNLDNKDCLKSLLKIKEKNCNLF